MSGASTTTATSPGRAERRPASGIDPEHVQVLLTGWVSVIRDGQVVAMSKRAGDIYLLDTLLDDIGVDAARWFFASRGANLDMDIDVDLARRQTSENPVYYVQYAHARIASILRKAADAGLTPAASVAGHLAGPPEAALARAIVRFPEVVEDAATSRGDARRHRLRDRARDAVPRLLSRRAGGRRGRAGAVGGAARARRGGADDARERPRAARDQRPRRDVGRARPRRAFRRGGL